ncbi:MAG: hypothetical protein B7733_06145 [Myxococcales bacterium FL481]|nr:MAG: hypothetical protein B7733_06145 [Myxococcales bacterium FL481]
MRDRDVPVRLSEAEMVCYTALASFGCDPGEGECFAFGLKADGKMTRIECAEEAVKYARHELDRRMMMRRALIREEIEAGTK